MTSLKEVAQWLALIESSLPVPQDEKTVDEYVDILLTSHYKDDPYTDILVSAWARIQKLRLATTAKAAAPRDLATMQAFIKHLCDQKQTAQRTAAWYEQGKRILTASEIYSLFRSPRQRAQMVFSKVETQYRMTQPLAVRSEKMSAFDWGIRFEPVVKQIFELTCCGAAKFAGYPISSNSELTCCSAAKHACRIEELGRILHPTDPRVAASPDGLIVEGPLEILGDLIEIKAPVTREIGHGIPDEYYAQMQTQLEVTQSPACQYIEMKFASPYNASPMAEGPALYSGYIYIVNVPGQPTDDNLFPEDRLQYVYGDVNSDTVPDLGGELVERVPWRCLGWFHQVVPRRPDWWASIQPAINQFWLDVEGAKAGTFTIPPSTRQPKAIKQEAGTLPESFLAASPCTNPDTHDDNCSPSAHNLTPCADSQSPDQNSSENQ